MASEEIKELADRAVKIRLPIKDWARSAGTTPQTIGRFAANGNGRTSTLAKLRLALVAEEHRLLAHLRQIHGDAA